MTAATARDWLRCYRPRPAARLRLVCFPYATGSATFYRSWAGALPEHVELVAVQYPGRLDRISEPCVPDMETMVDTVAGVLPPVLDRPVALFGHSMGAAIAFEVAHRLRARYGVDPVRLYVSGRPAPEYHENGVKHRGPDDVLWAELSRLGGTSAEVLDHADLRAALMPALRGDYRLIETYRPVPAQPLPCPITALLGDADPEVTPVQAGAWAGHTTAGLTLKVFPGNHFYLVDHRAAVLAEVVRGLES
ncbi:MAG TPA: alpha/beta fold hydrolase [Rugosimonospora sp.]|nr:alpha/beta fold hydrolase [Rugosimonospora sp.]